MILLLLKHISVQRNELKDGVITVDEKIMLKVENLSVNYGHIEALKNVSVEVKRADLFHYRCKWRRKIYTAENNQRSGEACFRYDLL